MHLGHHHNYDVYTTFQYNKNKNSNIKTVQIQISKFKPKFKSIQIQNSNADNASCPPLPPHHRWGQAYLWVAKHRWGDLLQPFNQNKIEKNVKLWKLNFHLKNSSRLSGVIVWRQQQICAGGKSTQRLLFIKVNFS